MGVSIGDIELTAVQPTSLDERATGRLLALHTLLRLEDDALDDLTHETGGDEEAAQANNDGPDGQIEFLCNHDWTEENLTRAMYDQWNTSETGHVILATVSGTHQKVEVNATGFLQTRSPEELEALEESRGTGLVANVLSTLTRKYHAQLDTLFSVEESLQGVALSELDVAIHPADIGAEKQRRIWLRR